MHPPSMAMASGSADGMVEVVHHLPLDPLPAAIPSSNACIAYPPPNSAMASPTSLKLYRRPIAAPHLLPSSGPGESACSRAPGPLYLHSRSTPHGPLTPLHIQHRLDTRSCTWRVRVCMIAMDASPPASAGSAARRARRGLADPHFSAPHSPHPVLSRSALDWASPTPNVARYARSLRLPTSPISHRPVLGLYPPPLDPSRSSTLPSRTSGAAGPRASWSS
jgi:hypothetical protein